MAETTQKKITLNNFFEQIVEINKVSQKALKKSNESLSVSEKTKIDLERLIQLLKVDFNKNVEEVRSESNKEVTNIIREDATEDRELRDSFLQLQSSFRDLSSAIGIIRKDLDSLSNAFLQMQKGRGRMIKQQDRQISKEEDTLQKEQILGSQQKQQRQQIQDQKRTEEQKESKIMSALKGLLGGGLLAGLGGAFGGGGGGGGGGDIFEDVTADTPQERALLRTIRSAEGTAGKGGYGKIFGGHVVPELEQGKLTIEEAARMSETGKLPERFGGRSVPYGKYKGRVSGATGAYQFMPGTMRESARRAGIPLDTPLTPEIQDKLGLSNVRASGVDPTKTATTDTLRQLEGQWTGLGSSQGGAGVDASYQRYKKELQQEQQKQIEIDKATKTLQDLDKLTKPQPLPGVDPPAMPFTTPGLFGQPQSYLSPQQRKDIPDLQKPSASIASVTLPPVSGGTQKVGGGQGRGQAATQSYAVQSTKNTMMFAQVLSGSFKDKMNITLG